MRDEIEVAVRAAAGTGSALTGEPDALTVLDALGNRDVEAFRREDLPGAVTCRAEAALRRSRAAAVGHGSSICSETDFLPPVIRFAQREIERRLEILAALRERAAAARCRRPTPEKNVSKKSEKPLARPHCRTPLSAEAAEIKNVSPCCVR